MGKSDNSGFFSETIAASDLELVGAVIKLNI